MKTLSIIMSIVACVTFNLLASPSLEQWRQLLDNFDGIHYPPKEEIEGYYDYPCENKDCECVFKENIQKVLIDTTMYGLFRNKREIRYRCSCPECGRVVTTIERPDEESDV